MIDDVVKNNGQNACCLYWMELDVKNRYLYKVKSCPFCCKTFLHEDDRSEFLRGRKSAIAELEITIDRMKYSPEGK